MSQRKTTSYLWSLRGASKAVFCAAAFTAACSGGALAQSSAPADTTKLIIGASSTGPGQIPLYVALQEGFFKKAGLGVENQMLSGGTPSAMAAFASGAVNILNLSAPELIQYTARKVVSGKAFGEIVDQTYDVIASKSITNIQDIKGKTIGISSPNGADQIYILAVMKAYGVSTADVTFITTGNPITRLAALTAGATQVTATTNAQREQSSNAGTVLLKSTDSPVQFPSNMFITNSDMLRDHKPLLKRFLSALSDTMVWMRANPAQAAADCAKSIGATVQTCTKVDALSFNRAVQNKFTWSSTLAVNVDGIKSALAVMATIDPSTKSLTVDDVADTSVAGTTP